MTAVPAGERIAEIVLDPQWSIGTVLIDGKSFPLMTIAHPRFGAIPMLISQQSLAQIVAGLHDLMEKPDAVS